LVTILLKMFLLRHATVAWHVIFLPAAANFFPDPQSPWVSLFGSPDCPAAGFLALCRFFRHLTAFTTVFLRDLLMLLHGLHHSWIVLNFLWIGTRHFLAGSRHF
jgi:hypothetical protein